MNTKKIVCFAMILIISMAVSALPVSYAAAPKYYQEKKAFYSSLSIVLNKYIVPVGNWGLLEGTLNGLQSLIGSEQFTLESETNILDLGIKDNPPLRLSRDKIDNNAIELVDSISIILDSTFDNFPDLDKTRIIHAAISGMVATLEPNSYFIEPEDLERLQAQNRGIFEGIGLEITTEDGAVTVVSPYEGTPAFRKGLRPKDRIIAVDGQATADKRIMEVSEKIRGPKGTSVTLTIERQDWDQAREITLVRDTISHRTVKSFLMEPGFGYIRIINFLGTTGEDFKKALNDLGNDTELEGLVIDLRYNPGGLLDQSLSVADFFLNTGLIATTDSRVQADNKLYYARPETIGNDYPIVVIINEGSASGTEVVAAALRTHHRAVLVGEQSYGKGFIQAIYPTQTGGAIRLTTSMLLTPEGDEIQNVGITPDLDINPSLLDYEKSMTDDPNMLPILTLGATRDDPAIQIGLDVVKRSLLLQDIPDAELEGLTDSQAAVKKRFYGLNRAVEEISQKRKLQNF